MNWTIPTSDRSSTRLERLALWALVAFTAAAVLGYATFGLHPQLMRTNPGAQRFYGTAFLLFARGQVLLSATVLGVALIGRARGRWLGGFAAIYLTSLCSELAGTTVGVPFGPFSYNFFLFK